MRVAYITGVCVNYDAISNAIHDEIGWLLGAGHELRLFAYACDYPDLPFTRVETLGDVAFDCFFQTCDVAVFHFGVFSPLFDLLPLVPQQARRVVVFHNITPKEFLPSTSHELIDRSFAQMANVAFADLVICDSEVNRQVLRSASLDVPATVMPLALSAPLRAPVRKPSVNDGVTRIAFIGRLVRSKGPVELLDALLEIMEKEKDVRLQVDLIGNLEFSDESTVLDVRNRMRSMKERYSARCEPAVLGSATPAAKERVLSDADLFVLPTYHEGFCVPILEALASGCRVVTYDNSNTPAISGGLADLVPTGDRTALTTAVSRAIANVGCRQWQSRAYSDYVTEAAAHVSAFSPDVIRSAFVKVIEDVAADDRREPRMESLLFRGAAQRTGASNPPDDQTAQFMF